MGSTSPGIPQNSFIALVLGAALLAAAAAGFGFSRDGDVGDTRQAALDAREARATALWEAAVLRPPRDVERDHWTPRKAGPETPIRRRRALVRPAPRPVVEVAAIGDESGAVPAAAALPAPRSEEPPVSAEPVRVKLPRVDWSWKWLHYAPGPVVANVDDVRTRLAFSVGEGHTGVPAAAKTPAPAADSSTPSAAPLPTAAVPTPRVASIPTAAGAPAQLPARSDAVARAATVPRAPVKTLTPTLAPELPVVAKSVPVGSARRPATPAALPREAPPAVPVAPSAPSVTKPAPARPVAAKPAPAAAKPTPVAPAPSLVASPASPPHAVTPAASPPAPAIPAASPPVVAQAPPSHAGPPDFVLSKARDLEDLHLPSARSIQVDARGALGGSGSVRGSLVVAGVFAPGHSPGLVEVEGDFALESDAVLEIELAGTDPEDFDRILVEGTATLSGVVNVVLLDGFVPGLGDTFEVILAQAIQDAGAVFDLPDLGPDLLLQLSIATTDAGQALVFSSVATAGAAGAAVPEPGTALLLAAALAAVALRRRVS